MAPRSKLSRNPAREAIFRSVAISFADCDVHRIGRVDHDRGGVTRPVELRPGAISRRREGTMPYGCVEADSEQRCVATGEGEG